MGAQAVGCPLSLSSLSLWTEVQVDKNSGTAMAHTCGSCGGAVLSVASHLRAVGSTLRGGRGPLGPGLASGLPRGQLGGSLGVATTLPFSGPKGTPGGHRAYTRELEDSLTPCGRLAAGARGRRRRQPPTLELGGGILSDGRYRETQYGRHSTIWDPPLRSTGSAMQVRAGRLELGAIRTAHATRQSVCSAHPARRAGPW